MKPRRVRWCSLHPERWRRRPYQAAALLPTHALSLLPTTVVPGHNNLYFVYWLFPLATFGPSPLGHVGQPTTALSFHIIVHCSGRGSYLGDGKGGGWLVQ